MNEEIEPQRFKIYQKPLNQLAGRHNLDSTSVYSR